MKKLYFFFAAMCCMMVANAQGFIVDGINYHVTSMDEHTVEVDKKVDGNYSGDVTIPATVLKPGSSTSYSVTGIGESAFQDCSDLTSIVIPESVTEIGLWAFQWCTSLETVTFAEDSQLSEIGPYAFYMCTELSSITIPASVKTIEDGAFAETALTSIEIPASVETIGDEAFYFCSSLETVTFAEDSQLSEIGGAPSQKQHLHQLRFLQVSRVLNMMHSVSAKVWLQ